MSPEEIEVLRRRFINEATIQFDALFTSLIVPIITGETAESDLDQVKRFIVNACQIGSGLETESGKLYQAFNAATNHPNITHKRFSQLVKAIGTSMGYDYNRKNGRSYWKGLNLREEEGNE